MESHQVPKIYFDGRIAQDYDADSVDMFDPAVLDPTVDFLAALARGGSALELGIGTGRVAIPLRQRGVEVHGIDLSPAMVEQLRAKPDASDITVTIGDFATLHVGRTFNLIYAVYNAITNLTTQDEQVACFQHTAKHLASGGHFVIEVFVPTLQRLPPGDTVRAFHVSHTKLAFDEYDIAAQMVYSHHYWVDHEQLKTFTSPHRYVWAAELDLMARLAGLHLVERWGSWHKDPFTSESISHISMWGKNPGCTGDVRY
jgi:SAM-dependent methyltransferase